MCKYQRILSGITNLHDHEEFLSVTPLKLSCALVARTHTLLHTQLQTGNTAQTLGHII